MTGDVILQISKLSKSFGPVKALKEVDFELRKGEIHAIAGENGAGKSTLMNIIDGILQPDSGEIWIDGAKTRIQSPAEAQKKGIGFVHQEIALCPDVSVAENIFMATTSASGAFLMDYKGIEAKARQVFAQLSTIDPAILVRDLSISNQQLVEIAKALTLDCRVLILDEPTAALTEAEAQVLFGIMRQLTDRGISIIYISHRMVEIFENCDRVSVFRDGRYVRTDTVADITPSDVVNAMVGRELGDLYPDKQHPDDRNDTEVLRVENLTEAERFSDVSFSLKKGEILGFAGLIGAGRSEIAKGICALEGEVTGNVWLNGAQLKLRDYQDSIEAGMVYLSEDRKGDGVFLDMSIASNVSALKVEQVASGLGLIQTRKEVDQADRLGRKLNLKCGGLTDPVSSLSGGNQQKVAIAKMLSVNPRLIFLDEPTRGVDVGAKVEIHRILRDLANEGVGIVVISSELPELIGVCDRVLVIHEGHITGEVTGDQMTEENIMHLASGADAALSAAQ
ncbi:sugar ABC transporter ATP-binding protein [Shimia sp. MMG029]|uniref:sugar ABC transporter ATP-binding protein n=1 Tax=Shimia sp. MMG029 TaxID=3021978 RepID=UPI0022FEBC05|nr:sugar ABC transporter ATP-binding protein [Shimia sp. MMG029]MDA5557770.1 sugar ABC transporter ATP-binding protein [Shimia sp. MMG029]